MAEKTTLEAVINAELDAADLPQEFRPATWTTAFVKKAIVYPASGANSPEVWSLTGEWWVRADGARLKGTSLEVIINAHPGALIVSDMAEGA